MGQVTGVIMSQLELEEQIMKMTKMIVNNISMLTMTGQNFVMMKEFILAIFCV